MYKKEKEKLDQYKQIFDKIDMPENSIDERIQAGIKQAKNELKPRFRINWFLSVAIVLIILVGFSSTIRIIDYVKDNKGLIGAIEHDYYEEINESVKKDDVEFNIDGVIADEKGIVIFYTIHSDKNRDLMELREFELQDSQGQEIKENTISYGGELKKSKGGKANSGMIEVFYKENQLLTDFKIVAEVTGSSPDNRFNNYFQDTFTIPFSITTNLSPVKEYEINQTVIIDGQKILFQNALISPIRTEINVLLDEENTKKILNFDDLRIVDEAGETWGIINNGIIASSKSDYDKTIYLQSNYFKDPQELYIELNKIQAVDKAESKVIVDPKKEKIIKQPKGNLLTEFKVEGGYLVFEMEAKPDDEHSGFGFVAMYDENGEEISYNSNYFRQGNKTIEVGVSFNHNYLDQLISLEIGHYPLWITGEEKIKIK